MKKAASELKSKLLNPIGLGLTFLNLTILGMMIWIRGNWSSSGFHFFNEPLIAQVFLVLNLPALALAGLLLIPLAGLLVGINPNEANAGFQILILAIAMALQWLIIGFLLTRRR